MYSPAGTPIWGPASLGSKLSSLVQAPASPGQRRLSLTAAFPSHPSVCPEEPFTTFSPSFQGVRKKCQGAVRTQRPGPTTGPTFTLSPLPCRPPAHGPTSE